MTENTQQELGTILIVEDEIDIAEIVRETLSGLSTKILHAMNGTAAGKILDENSVDVIISDISMPDMNGIEFLGNVRKRGLNTPFILMSAFSDNHNAAAALRLGAFDFLEKPADLELLRKVVTNGLRLSKIQKEIPCESVKKIVRLRLENHIVSSSRNTL